METMHARATLALACLFALSIARPVEAQPASTRVQQLEHDAMSAYAELDLERAEQLLQSALELAQREHVVGTPLARVHLSLGVLAVAGYSDQARGVESFMRALEIDPSIQPDPMMSTPEVQSALALARSRMSSGGRPSTAPRPPQQPAMRATLRHVGPMEQAVHVAIPLFVEPQNGGAIVRIAVLYRGNGMRRFREIAMQRMGTGYGVEIPCEDSIEGDFAYYIVAYDDSERLLANAGTESTPLHVRIVRRLSGTPPALPSRAPPEACSQDERPPGMAGPTPTPPPIEDEAAPATPTRPRLFLQVGGVVGAYRAAPGMLADGAPPNGFAGTPRYAGYVPDGADGCDVGAGLYCVRVSQSGVVPVFGARLMLGYWVSPRWAIAVGARGGPGGGKSTLSYLMLSFRAQVLVSNPADTRFHASLFFGTSLGQVQVRPDQRGSGGVSVVAPWAQAGLGSLQLGTVLGYRFLDHLGVFVELDGSVFYRRFNVGADVTMGLELSF